MSQDETAPVNEDVTEVPESTPDTEVQDQDKTTSEQPQTESTTEEPSQAEKAAGDAVTKQAEEYLAGWQRTRAEFANYKKRVERELREGRERGAQDAISKILPLVDDLERAMYSLPDELADNPWTKGIALMLPKFQKLLTEYEVEPMDPVGEVFDPSRHEAIGMDDTDEVESGHVTVTLQKGYISGDRVLRPALVRVAN